MSYKDRWKNSRKTKRAVIISTALNIFLLFIGMGLTMMGVSSVDYEDGITAVISMLLGCMIIAFVINNCISEGGEDDEEA